MVCNFNVMETTESLLDFYKRKFNWLPENIRNEVGHFNLFHHEPYVEGKPTAIPYRRRDFYKINLVKGNSHGSLCRSGGGNQKAGFSFF